MLLDIQRRHELVREFKIKFAEQEKVEMDTFVCQIRCKKCSLMGAYKGNGCCYYTAPGGYAAECSFCGEKVVYGYTSIPHWNVSDEGVVTEVSGRVIKLWDHT